MGEIRLEIGDPKSKKTYSKKLLEEEASKFNGLKIRDKFRGEVVGLTGYEFLITGGSDSSGFPMRPTLQGRIRRKFLIRAGVGFKSRRKGERRRKTIRGNEIGSDIAQINCKVLKEGSQSLAKALGLEKEVPKEEPKPEEKPKEKEESKEAPKEGVPKEEKSQDKKESSNSKENK